MRRRIAAAPLLCVALVLSNWTDAADSRSSSRVTVAPGLSVPKVNELKRKVERALGQPSGTKLYTRQGDRRVEVTPLPVTDLSAVVRSYDEKQGTAHVYFVHDKYRMPVWQMWWFNGKNWSDSIDPGIFIR